MDSPQFNVVVDGNVLSGFEAAAVLLQLQQQLKLAETKALLLIAGKRVTVKRNVDAAVANAYCKRLQLLGVSARVETVNVAVADIPAPQTIAKPTVVPIPVKVPRYFSETPIDSREIANASAFNRAVMRANAALRGTVLKYTALALFSVILCLFYVLRYASFAATPPIFFSATVYLIVCIVLATLATLLLRPLLPRKNDDDTDILLSPFQESAVFSFVAQLCEKLALKSPEQITLTTATANTASLLPGFKNLQRGDYRLSISLPQLENGSMQQFAGLLAADVATQAKISMLRYRWLIDGVRGQINHCLVQQDWLAQRAEAIAQAAPKKLSPLFALINRLIDQHNQYLEKISARIAHIDTQLQRPLLHEQDRYTALIAGSQHFSRLMIFRARLDAAATDANAKNQEERIEGGLVDDLPALIQHYYDGIEENFAQTLPRKWNAETTPRSNEPPIMRERIEVVSSAAKPGAIDDEKSAQSLLQQRDELARAATQSSYRKAGFNFDAATLMPVDELTYAATQDILQRQQTTIYFNDWFKPFRFWSLADFKLIGDMPLQDAAAQLSVCVNEIRRLTPDRAKLFTEYERLQNQLREILIAQHVLAAGKKYAFRYIHYDGTTLVPFLEERQRDIAALMEKLAQQETVMGGRITLGLRLSGQAEREVHELHDALRLLHDSGARLYKLSLDCFQLEQLLRRQFQLREADYKQAIKKLETKIDDACTLLIVRLNDIPYPLDKRHRSLKSFVEAALAQPAGKHHSPILQRAQRLLDVLYRVNEKLSRQAADYGTIAEEAYRIEPIRLVGNN